jgi:hypothetical protein
MADLRASTNLSRYGPLASTLGNFPSTFPSILLSTNLQNCWEILKQARAALQAQ